VGIQGGGEERQEGSYGVENIGRLKAIQAYVYPRVEGEECDNKVDNHARMRGYMRNGKASECFIHVNYALLRVIPAKADATTRRYHGRGEPYVQAGVRW